MNTEQLFKHRLAKLISIPSVSATRPEFDMANEPVLHELASWLEALGFSCEIQKLAGAPGKANLLAKLGEGEGGLVLAGHSDTVPFDAELWQSDPLKVSEKDQRLYGLGSSDMKGFFPVVLAAIEALKLRPENLREPLFVLATADEESSMIGARTLVKLGALKARFAIIGEPTGLKPIRMHKGIVMERIRIQGQSGHSSNPALGRSALEAMHAVIGELLQFRSDIQRKYQHKGFDIEVPTLNLGCIHGGDNPNRICGHCEMEFDLRPVPGMKMAILQDELSTRLQAVAERFGTPLELEEIFGTVEAYEQSADSELVRLCEKLSGQTPQSVAFATEAPFLQSLGMQTVVMGPGSIDQAHQPNEYVELAQIKPAIDIIKSAILACCI